MERPWTYSSNETMLFIAIYYQMFIAYLFIYFIYLFEEISYMLVIEFQEAITPCVIGSINSKLSTYIMNSLFTIL